MTLLKELKWTSIRRIAPNFEIIILQGCFSNKIDNSFLYLIRGFMFFIERLMIDPLIEERAASRAWTLQWPKHKIDKDEEVTSISCD